MIDKKVAAAVLLSCGVGVASAAPADWAGPYVGVHAGYAKATGVDLDWGFSDSDNFDVAGAMYGLHIGNNWAVNSWVVGVEASYSALNADGDGLCPNPSWTCAGEMENLLTVKARAGKPVNDYLVYGALGYAAADTEIKTVDTGGTGTAYPDTARATGWVLGVGVEKEFGNMVGRLEVQKVDLDANDYTVDFGSVVSSEMDPVTIAVGVSWRF